MLAGKRNWKLRHWIVAGYSIPILALIMSSGVTVYNVNVLTTKSKALQHSNKVATVVSDLAVQIQIASRTTRGYMLDQSPVSRDGYQDAKQHYNDLFEELKAITLDEQQRQRLVQLDKRLSDYSQFSDDLINLVSQNKAKQAIETWKAEDGRKIIGDLTALIEAIQERESELVATNTQQEAKALDSLKMTILLATAISLILSGVVGAWIIKRTARQMDESASGIASSTSEIAATIEQQERSASQQAASVNETTTTMEELGASSRQSAEQAEAAAAGARQALSLAGNGTKAVERSLDGMGTLRQKVGAIADQILRLSEQTSQIGSISILVSDLANQTNMLALNAAVEAVRAGEHGKGFSVVAGEIRKLADQSRNSAEKISALVNDIQNAINSTVMATDEGTKTVEEGVRIAQETSESFAGVTDAVNNVVLNSQQISLNVKQQAIAIQQVVEAMNSLNIAAKETAAGISQIRVGTQRLNDSATELKAVV